MTNKINLYERWFYWVQTVLPTTYTQALSYYEVVNALVDKIGEIVEYVEGLEDAAVERAKQYTDQQVGKLRGDLTKIINDNKALNEEQHAAMREEYLSRLNALDQEVEGLHQDVRTLNAIIESKLLEINVKLGDLWTAIAKNVDWLDDKLDRGLQDIKDYVDKLIGECTGDIPVIDPTTGKMNTLQNTLDNMWDNYNLFGITAGEYDSLNLTAEEYDALQITAYDYDHFFKLYYLERKWFWMYSPFDGKRKPIKDVVLELAELHMQGITAGEYDSLLMTALAYDDKDITAYDYDWRGRIILLGDIEIPEGLSPELEESFRQVLDSLNRLTQDQTSNNKQLADQIKQTQDDLKETQVDVAQNSSGIKNAMDNADLAHERISLAEENENLLQGRIEEIERKLELLESGGSGGTGGTELSEEQLTAINYLLRTDAGVPKYKQIRNNLNVLSYLINQIARGVINTTGDVTSLVSTLRANLNDTT